MSTCSVTQILHHALVSLKRRKWLISVACATIVFALFLVFTHEREPKYEGQRLSEWLEQAEESPSVKPRAAVQNIGTNAMPFLLKWIDREPSSWRMSLRKKLPTFILKRRAVYRWLADEANQERPRRATLGFYLLGTNAATAIPQLEALMNNKTKTNSSIRAIYALGGIGEPAIPVLLPALTDKNRSDRSCIAYAFELMPRNQETNTWVTTASGALNNRDPAVRRAATGIMRYRTEGLEALINVTAE